MYNQPTASSLSAEINTRQHLQAPELSRVSTPGQLGELISQANNTAPKRSLWRRLLKR